MRNRVKRAWLLLLAALLLAQAGCAKKGVWRFELGTQRDADDYTARDGTLLAWYSYELPRLKLVCVEGTGEPPPELTAACETFNETLGQWHASLLDEYWELEQLAIAAYPGAGAQDVEALGESVSLMHRWQTERFLSLRADGWADWGGARPIPFTVTWSFDLAQGRFVTWRELSDRPDALCAVLADAVLGQIGSLPGYFPDCAARVGRMEGAEVYFAEDGVHVVFSVDTIAPRGERLPEFRIPYERLDEYWNARGRELLGREKS